MKKLVLSIAIMLTLTACPAPSGTSTNPSSNPNGTVGGGLSADGTFTTKQEYINFITCVKSKPEVSAEQRAQLDLAISSVAMIPDAQWALVGAQFSMSLKQYMLMGGCG